MTFLSNNNPPNRNKQPQHEPPEPAASWSARIKFFATTHARNYPISWMHTNIDFSLSIHGNRLKIGMRALCDVVGPWKLKNICEHQNNSKNRRAAWCNLKSHLWHLLPARQRQPEEGQPSYSFQSYTRRLSEVKHRQLSMSEVFRFSWFVHEWRKVAVFLHNRKSSAEQRWNPPPAWFGLGRVVWVIMNETSTHTFFKLIALQRNIGLHEE